MDVNTKAPAKSAMPGESESMAARALDVGSADLQGPLLQHRQSQRQRRQLQCLQGMVLVTGYWFARNLNRMDRFCCSG